MRRLVGVAHDQIIGSESRTCVQPSAMIECTRGDGSKRKNASRSPRGPVRYPRRPRRHRERMLQSYGESRRLRRRSQENASGLRALSMLRRPVGCTETRDRHSRDDSGGGVAVLPENAKRVIGECNVLHGDSLVDAVGRVHGLTFPLRKARSLREAGTRRGSPMPRPLRMCISMMSAPTPKSAMPIHAISSLIPQKRNEHEASGDAARDASKRGPEEDVSAARPALWPERTGASSATA